MTEFVYIWSGEWVLWWRPGGHGYTHNRAEAGTFTRAEAERLTRHCGPEKKIELVPVENTAP